MRTTINVSDELMDSLMKYTGARTKTQAIETAVREFLKRKAVEDLIAMSGKIDIYPDWQKEEEAELDEYRDHS